GAAEGKPVAFFADTFNRYFEPENIDAALRVLVAAGYGVHLPKPPDGKARPLCCGRTFLAVGLIEEAKRGAQRTISARAPFAGRGIPIVGLEPSCMLGFRDEIPPLIKSEDADLLSRKSFLFEDILAQGAGEGTLDLPLKAIPKHALLHGHCHQKS